MKKNLVYTTMLSMGIISLSSCISTEEVKSSQKQEPSKAVVLNLNAPKEASTRADDSHLLRYTAKLFIGSPSNIDQSTMQRKELVEGFKGELGNENQIVFYLDPNTQYTIYIFADYVPKDKVNLAGGASDYYYNTTLANDQYRMYTNAGKNYTEIGEDFFNNDHYDCFIAMVSDAKNEGKNEHNVTLKRAVSKVRFVDTSKNTGVYNITGSSLKQCYIITAAQGTIGAMGDETYRFSGLSIADKKDLTSSEEEKELFYYYTFANSGINSTTNNIVFNIKGEDNSFDKTYEIKNIQARQNYVTTVKGLFLSDKDTPEDPGNGDPENPNDPNDPEQPGQDDPLKRAIILNMAIEDSNWGQQTIDWEEQ